MNRLLRVGTTLLFLSSLLFGFSALTGSSGVSGDADTSDTVKASQGSGASALHATTPSGPAVCALDASKSEVEDWGSLVNMQDPMKGNPGADVTVIEYFDPNCPHCKDHYEATQALVEEYGDSVRFVYKPFPLGRQSLQEIEALYVAAQQNKFFELLEAQFQRQSGGITESDLRRSAQEVGMNADALIQKVNGNPNQSYILQERQKAINIGVSSTPSVLVNGHFVGDRSPECMRTYIEQAKNGELG